VLDFGNRGVCRCKGHGDRSAGYLGRVDDTRSGLRRDAARLAESVLNLFDLRDLFGRVDEQPVDEAE